MDAIAEQRDKLYINYYVFRELTMSDLIGLQMEINKKVWDLFAKDEKNILTEMQKNYYAKPNPIDLCDSCSSSPEYKDREYCNPISELVPYFKETTAMLTRLECEEYIYTYF